MYKWYLKMFHEIGNLLKLGKFLEGERAIKCLDKSLGSDRTKRRFQYLILDEKKCKELEKL